MLPVRRAAVAGSWYPAEPEALAREVDRYLSDAGEPPAGDPIAIIAPHAGLMYSGPIAAHAYSMLRGRDIDVAVLVGPSHYVGFDGVAIYERGVFETPFGPVLISEHCADAIALGSQQIRPHPAAHVREHSLEMQLPFLKRVLPDAEIVPLVMGHQRRDTAYELGDAIAAAVKGRKAVIVASTDLSHYQSAATAAKLDGRVVQQVQRWRSCAPRNCWVPPTRGCSSMGTREMCQETRTRSSATWPPRSAPLRRALWDEERAELLSVALTKVCAEVRQHRDDHLRIREYHQHRAPAVETSSVVEDPASRGVPARSPRNADARVLS
jgi:AmmeMemoRadiSam system protein B